jgi:general secretion pathway protein B
VPAAPSGAAVNPDDYAPAADATPSTGFGTHVRRATADGVPLYQEAAAVPGTSIPQLRLDLHVFAARPQERFVMINMKKLHEGDTLPEGVHVESITPEGAVLSYQGSRFLLPRD